MKRQCIAIIAALLGLVSQLQAQQQEPNQVSPDGLFDVVFDHYGNKYSLDDLRINRPKPAPKTGDALAGNVIPPSALLCSSGYFNIYFEEGSGCELNSTLHIDRRNVICQVFTDLSNFIVPANPNVKVNIWVRNIGNILSYPNATPVLGLASSFYTVPTIPSPAGGIIDGEIWKTINTGVDGFENVAAPLNSTGSAPGSGAFYHGMLAINFSQTSLLWHTDLTTATAANTYDLYTTVLHEVTHALGFASLIGSTGQPVFGSAYPFYSRYDLFLKNHANNNLIENQGTCSMYDYFWNPWISPIATLNPNISQCVPDRTMLCHLAVKFMGNLTNQEVYTPNCYEQGSSLSHFEDECHYLGSNNTYFCMANAGSTGPVYMSRYLKPEERDALCDMGYKVNTLYGNGLYTGNDFNYGGSQCPGLEVGGVNDRMDGSGAYTWAVLTNGNVSFLGNEILMNDFGADEFECLEVINGLGTVNVTSGNSLTSVTFTAGSSTGVALLRYIPVNTQNGNRGNITYVHIYIYEGNCLADACNMILNNGFEIGTSCGIFPIPDRARISCWNRLIGTPDYFVRNCVPFDADKTIPTGSGITNNPSDSWNGTGNDAFLGLGFYNGWMEESEQTLLSTPLIPGVSYLLSFWAKSANSTSGGFSGENKLMFRGSSGIMALQPAGSFTSLGDLLTEVTVPDDDEWHHYAVEFTASNLLDNLMVSNLGNNTGSDSYIFMDDLVITPANITTRFELQESLCDGETTLDDLSHFVFPPPTNGTFTGPGVSYTGGIPSFTAPGYGLYTLLYTYINSAGCTISLPAQIYVSNRPRPQVILTSNPSTPPAVLCGTPVTLTATGAKSYEWYSPFSSGATIPCTGPCSSIVVTPPPPGYLFMVIGTDTFGCKDSVEIYIQVDCGGGAGYTMPENVKHYTTKMVPPDYVYGLVNHSILAGTIFGQATGTNRVHFMRINGGMLLTSIEYPSNYSDERAVDLQSVTIGEDTYWYIICLARSGAKTMVKLLNVDEWGNLLNQTEYEYPGGDLYPMNSTVWVDANDEVRLYICGYQTPSLGSGMPNYNTNKEAFVMAVDITPNSPNHMNSIWLNTYDWPWAGTQDFDIATRMHVLKDGSNNLWITGSTNGTIPIAMGGVPKPDDRSAAMNMVIDPSGIVVHERNFIGLVTSDNHGGPFDYGIDLIQAEGKSFILGNKVSNQGHAAWHPNNPVLMYPRANKSWWIQPIDNFYNPSGPRGEFWNFWGHWASHAIHTDGLNVTVATLTEYQYSTCIPFPYTPNFDNIQANLLNLDLSASSPYHWQNTKSIVYRTSSGTGDPTVLAPANSYYLLGDALTLIDYPPTFAAMGIGNFVVNAPKYDNTRMTLNLKVASVNQQTLGFCGGWDCTIPPVTDTAFLEEPIDYPPTSVVPFSHMVIDNPSFNTQTPFQVHTNPYRCFDFAGNPTYRLISPYPVEEEAEEPLTEKTKLFPNPADEMITVQPGMEIRTDSKLKILIRNSLGQEIKTLYDGSYDATIYMNISDLVPGVYMVIIYADSVTVFTEKVIVN